MHQYYVQVIANNYLKNLVDTPQQMKVDKNFLHGLSEDDFINGFYELLDIIRQLYTDVLNTPAEFGMPLKENLIFDAKNADYTQSNAGFVRLPNLLLLLGSKGTLDKDMMLLIDGADLLTGAKLLKLTKPQALLEILPDYGFEITGVTKTLKAGDQITVSYPENRYTTVALKSMADAMMLINKDDLRKSKNHFYMMNYKMLENETSKEPKLTVDYLLHALTGINKRTAEQLNGFIIEHAKASVRMGGFMRNDWSCVYTLKSNKKVIMSLNTCHDNLVVKLNLANIGRYIESLHDHTNELKQMVEGGWGCGRCNSSCAGGFEFEYDGKAYNKCRCGSFNFDVITDDSVDFYLDMLKKELKSIA